LLCNNKTTFALLPPLSTQLHKKINQPTVIRDNETDNVTNYRSFGRKKLLGNRYHSLPMQTWIGLLYDNNSGWSCILWCSSPNTSSGAW